MQLNKQFNPKTGKHKDLTEWLSQNPNPEVSKNMFNSSANTKPMSGKWSSRVVLALRLDIGSWFLVNSWLKSGFEWWTDDS